MYSTYRLLVLLLGPSLSIIQFNAGGFQSQIISTLNALQDFSSRKQQQESFLHRCNSLFEMLIRFTETCTSASGLNLSALQKKKEDANDYWLSICTSLEAEIAKASLMHVHLMSVLCVFVCVCACVRACMRVCVMYVCVYTCSCCVILHCYIA